jgi:hypothetical protein
MADAIQEFGNNPPPEERRFGSGELISLAEAIEVKESLHGQQGQES